MKFFIKILLSSTFSLLLFTGFYSQAHAMMLAPTAYLTITVTSGGGDALFPVNLLEIDGIHLYEDGLFDLQTENGTTSTTTILLSPNSTYVFTEDAPKGWTLASTSCSSDIPDVTFSQQSNGVSISNVAYSNIACTFHNVKTPPPPTECTPGTPGCYSNVMFLPGIEGSKLYDSNREVWLPTSDSEADELRMDANGNSLNPDITTLDALGATGAEQLDHKVYQDFLDEMQDWQTQLGIIATTTPYDWRLDYSTLLANGRKLPNGHISYLEAPEPGHDPYLIEMLKYLASKSKTGKVTIIAHSNGGLLAKALMLKLGATTTASLIDKVIFVDVPQVGTPQAIAGLLHGAGQSISKYIIGTAISSAEARSLGQNMPMSYNLLPTNQYFTYTDNPVVTFDSASLPSWANAYLDSNTPDAGVHSTELLRNFMTDTPGVRTKPAFSDTATPEIVNGRLFDAATIEHIALDNWTPPAGVQLFTIAGWGNETLSGLEYKREIDGCDLYASGNCVAPTYEKQVTYDPKTVIDGDGTVVESSEQWAGGATSTRYWVNLLNYNKTIFGLNKPDPLRTGHAEILTIPEVNLLLSEIFLKGNQAQLPIDYITNTRPIYTGSDARLHFILHSPLTLGFEDSQGDYTGSTATTTVFNIPGVDYRRFGEVQWLSVPKNLAGKVIMRGIGSGSFSLDVEDVNGDTTLATTTFSGVPSATSTVATLNIDPNVSPTASSTLNVDFNGDGVVDTRLQSKQGEIVLPDFTPPEAILSADLDAHDLGIMGTDTQSSTTVVQSATSTVITDFAGNQTTLTFQKMIGTKSFTRTKLTSIQYGHDKPIDEDVTFTYLWLRNDLLSQTVKVGNQLTIEALYNKRQDKTTIIVHESHKSLKIQRVDGLAIIKLNTNKGSLSYEW